MKVLVGFRYRELIIPPWLGQELLDSAIEDAVVNRIKADLVPLYTDEEWAR